MNKKIFISYSHDDIEIVSSIYTCIIEHGFNPWLDKHDLLPGQIWEDEIKIAIEKSNLVLLFLSKNAINKRGFLQKEIREALDIFDYIPEGVPFLIPVRIEPCRIPNSLKHIQWVDLFMPGGKEKLIKTLQYYLEGADMPKTIQFIHEKNYIDLLNKLMIIPNNGVLSISLGDSDSRIRNVLGKPNDTSIYDDCWFLSYYQLGVSFRIEEHKCKCIFLYGDSDNEFLTFRGTTKEGIGTTSSRKLIEKVYGMPDSTLESEVWNFQSIYNFGLTFVFNTINRNDYSAKLDHIKILLRKD